VDTDNYGVITQVAVAVFIQAVQTVDVYVDCAAISNAYIGSDDASTQYCLAVNVVGSGQ